MDSVRSRCGLRGNKKRRKIYPISNVITQKMWEEKRTLYLNFIRAMVIQDSEFV